MNASTIPFTLTALVALAGVACASDPDSPPPPRSRAAIAGKPQAPVDVTATFSGATARVTLAFQADATGVVVEVRGVDGLAVTSPARPVADASYAAGAHETLTVALAPPAEPSNLVVTVRGTFAGVPATKVTSFTVGDARAKGRGTAAVKTDPSGARIKELPGERR